MATPMLLEPVVEATPNDDRPRRGGVARALVASPLGAAALGCVVVVVALALLAPVIWGGAAGTHDLDALSQGPSGAHIAGTDSLGRDIFLRVLVATRISVGLALAATVIAVTIGLVLGTLPVIAGPRIGRAINAAVDVAVAFPALLLAIFFAVIFGVGQTGAVIALGMAGGPYFARLTQTLAASVAGQDFVAAARVGGVGRLRILTRHVLPNIGEPLAVNAAIGAALNLLAFAGLSFLGIGVQAPAYDWGRLLNEGLGQIYVNPMAAVVPGVAIVLAGLAFNLAGEAAAQVLGRRVGRTRRGDRDPERPASAAGDVREPADPGAVLDVDDLWVWVTGSDGRRVAPVRGVSLRLAADEAVGIVGESGSGKSLTALAVAQLHETPTTIRARRLAFEGEDLIGLGDRERRSRLAGAIAVVFQDPMSSLNPTMRVGNQLAEVARAHQGAGRRAAMERAVDRLRAVRIDEPERRARQYPYELSGGMRQRAMIGMGLMGRPRLLVADEPTTALDVTVQRHVLDLLAEVRAEAGSTLLMISHDIAVVAGICDRVLVMYAGRVVEELPVAALTTGPAHPYTRALVAALPDMRTPRDRPLPTIPGRPPAPGETPPGCAYAPRCPFATDRCRAEDPALVPVAADHRAACWHPQAGPVGARPEARA